MKKTFLCVLALLLPLSAAYAGDEIVAKVNGAAITSRDLEIEVDRLIPRATYHGTVSRERRGEFREKALENVIERELRYQDALARGMKPDRKIVKERMKQTRDKFRSKKEYRDALERAGFTEDELQKRIEKDALVQAVIAKTVTEPARMSDGALKEYYDVNVAKFKQPESVRLRIFSSKDEQKARDALQKLKAGEDFALLAERSSEDNYRVKGGDLGYIHRGTVLSAVEDAAFKLKPGETSGLINAEGMWFIIRVEDKRPERQMTFDESKDKLGKELEGKRSAELMETWMAGLRSKARIEKLWKAPSAAQ